MQVDKRREKAESIARKRDAQMEEIERQRIAEVKAGEAAQSPALSV